MNWIDDLFDEWEIDEGLISLVESLLKTSNYSLVRRDEVHRNLLSYTQEETEELIKDLTENQLDPIQHGLNYSQTDILNKLNKL